MKILIDIGHPGHVHLFKYFAHLMIQKGNKVHFTLRDKEFEKELLKNEGFTFTNFGRKYNSLYGKLWGLLKFTIQETYCAIKYKPDVLLSHGSMYAAIASWIIRKPHISFEDTFNMEQIKLYRPFTKVILAGSYQHPNLGKKEINYDSYHEIAYLHQNYFKPDSSIFKSLGIEPNSTYFIVRFVSWKASHDFGQNRLSENQKFEIITELSKKGKVFISSEKKLPETLERFKIPISPNQMHHALAYAKLFVGEGATMASECAVLGTPAIYINALQAGSIDDQEKHGLLYHLSPKDNILLKINELLSDNEINKKTISKRDTLLKGKIDLTAFLIWFVENYPQSIKIITENPNYQYNFK